VALVKAHTPKLYELVPRLNLTASKGLDQGNCAGLATLGWKDMEFVYGNYATSAWWYESRRYGLCMATMKHRFLTFMAGNGGDNGVGLSKGVPDAVA
jgi:hypothetical protein